MRGLLPIGLVLLLAACSPETPTEEEATSAAVISTDVPGAPVATLTTLSGEMRLGITDEVLYVGLADQIAEQAQKDLENAEAGGGLGGFIAGAVSNALVGALETPFQIPLEEVKAMRYENGQLEVDMESGASNAASLTFDEEATEPLFDPEDAQRFVDAFNELKGL